MLPFQCFALLCCFERNSATLQNIFLNTVKSRIVFMCNQSFFNQFSGCYFWVRMTLQSRVSQHCAASLCIVCYVYAAFQKWNCISHSLRLTQVALGLLEGQGGVSEGGGMGNKESFFTLPPDPITPFLGCGDERLACNWRGGNKWK